MTPTQLPAVGLVLPLLEQRLELPDLVAYAGATWDWYRVHYDNDASARAGFSAPLVDGQMLGAFLARQAMQWAGPRGRLRRMSFRFKSPVVAGEVIRCESTVTALEVREGRTWVTLTQSVKVGTRVAVGDATAVVELVGE
jgi:acyl dehydratase